MLSEDLQSKNEELKKLILEIRNNNQNSLLKVIDIFDPYVKKLSNDMNDKDSYCELLCELFEILIQLELDKDNLRAYINKCLKNYSYKINRKYKYNIYLDESIENIYGTKKDTIENELLNIKFEDYNKKKYSLFQEVIKSLQGIEKDMFIDYFLYEKSVKYMQNKYKKSKSTVYLRLNKAKQIVEDYVFNNISI